MAIQERLQNWTIPLRSSMAQQSALSLAIKIFATGCGFLFAVMAARLLGPDGYGVVAVAMSVATTAATIAPLGSNGLAVREVARSFAHGRWADFKQFIRWSGALVAVASLCVGGALLLIAPVTGPYSSALPYSAVLVPFLAGSLWLRGVIQGASKSIAAQLPGDAIRWAVTLAVIGVLSAVVHRVSSTQVLLAYIVGCAFALGVSIAIASKLVSGLPISHSPSVGPKSWLQNSLPFLGITAIGILGTEINTLLLGSLSGPREAGLYQPIAKVAPLMLLVRDAIEMPLAPRIVHDWEHKNTEALQRRLHRAALGSTIVTAIIVIAIVFAAPIILGAFGREFVANADLLLWIGGAQIVNSAMGAGPLLLSMVGGMKERAIAQLLTLIVQAGLALALVPMLGARGAAISLVAAILVWSIANWALAWRITGLNSSIFARHRSSGGNQA